VVNAERDFMDGAAVRVLVFGGIALLALNMLLGEVFAVFVSHVANGEIRGRWLDVVAASRAGDWTAAQSAFDRIDVLLERRGRFMNTHSHAGAFGMLALAMALLQPLAVYSNRLQRTIAAAFVGGGLMQPLFVFVSLYTGTWAHGLSDVGGALVIGALAATLAGLVRGALPAVERLRARLDYPSSRLLLRWGAALIVAGMAFGFYHAVRYTFEYEPRQFAMMDEVLAATGDAARPDPGPQTQDYRKLQSKMAILTAAHSHAIEMGLIALLLAFVQGYVAFGARVRQACAWAFLLGATALPICIYNATIFGLRAAAFADLSGLVVLGAMLAMAVGMIRETGWRDLAPAGAP
jgi:hypothetical protein